MLSDQTFHVIQVLSFLQRIASHAQFKITTYLHDSTPHPSLENQRNKKKHYENAPKRVTARRI